MWYLNFFLFFNYYLPIPFSALLIVKTLINLLFIFRFSGAVIGIQDVQSYLDGISKIQSSFEEIFLSFTRSFILMHTLFHPFCFVY